ncbi:MAG: DNA-binding protein, partial [Terriglobia bacterium]
MKTLYLAWQDSLHTRSWYPIGRLDADLSQPLFSFGYTRGAMEAHERAGLEPLDSFPDFRERYESRELFPLFRNRVLSHERVDFREYLKFLDLQPENADPMEILAVSGGERQTDSLEVFPKVEPAKDGGFRCRFFLHGWRHISSAAQARLEGLTPGGALQVAVELNNTVTTLALLVLTPDDCQMIGWAPRYLVSDLMRA